MRVRHVFYTMVVRFLRSNSVRLSQKSAISRSTLFLSGAIEKHSTQKTGHRSSGQLIQQEVIDNELVVTDQLPL
jgi:hypothetical protein